MPDPHAPTVTLVLDAADLDATEEFWSRVLGYRSVRRERPGLPNEVRTAESPLFPEMAVVFQRCTPRPVKGSTPGSLRRVALAVGSLAAMRGRLEGVTVVSSSEGPPPSVTIVEPNGYQLSLVERRPAGSA
ncbi:MAG: hypothetical protein IBJ11_12030 [Phycisphaerales bacterium]|nr:hypothetical protein [Phycisphaerales bacterium]